MTRKERLEAERQAKLDVARKAEAEAKDLAREIAKEAQKEARAVQARIGQVAHDAGLAGVSLEVFAAVFALLASIGTHDDDIRTWIEVLTDEKPTAATHL